MATWGGSVPAKAQLRAPFMGAVLPSDEDEVAAEARRTRDAECWTRTLRAGVREDTLATLDAIEARALEDEEVVCALGNAATDAALLALVHARDGDEDVRERAGDVYATCVKQCPSGAAFPACGLVQTGTFVACAVGSLALPTALRLRLPRHDRFPSVSAMVWHSSIALGRYLFRPEVRAWVQAFGRARGRETSALEIGGGAMVAGLAFSCSFPDEGWDVVLSDVDNNAVVNARYNIERQKKFQPAFNAKTRSAIVDWNADDDSDSDSDSDSDLDSDSPSLALGTFDIILGADVVHEEPHSHGVIRALTKYLDPNGVALIVNPAPASRGGADTFRQLLNDDTRWNATTTRITNSIIRVGMEDETEDVPLDFYVIQKHGAATEQPPLEVMR